MAEIPLKQIGRYQVLRLLGHGAIGTAYLARDTLIEREVVLKVFPKSFFAEYGQPALREAPHRARLAHPNIVALYDFGESDGHAFVAMEYVTGQTLAEVVRQRAPLSLIRILEVMDQLCAGLAAAHRVGVIHGDIKPANLMINQDGLLKILDLGIPRLPSSDARFEMALGTPNYLAPEQIEGKPADARSDVFATGAVFYEILAYRKAFTGDTPAAVIKHVLSDLPEPLDRLAPNLDSRVVGIVNRCMEKRPEDRYPGAELVRRDVQVVLRDARSGNASPAPPRRSPEDDRMAQPEAQIEALIERARLALDRGAFAEARARNVLDSSQLDAALVAVEEALRLDPLNADARALREQIAALLESRRRAELLEHVLREARRRFEEGRYEAALASLHHAEQSDPRLDALRQELTERLRQVEEQSRRTRATEERQVEVLRPPATAAGPAGGVARTEIPTVIRSPAKSPWSPSTAIGILALPVMLVVSGVKTAVDALKRVARPRTEASGAQPPPPGQPLPVDDPVLLGVSAPRRGNPGATFPARFAAYVKTRESAVEDHLRRLDDALRGNVQTVVGLPPARGGRWMIGAPITVRVNGEHLKVKPSVQSFEWNGSENVVSFLVTVDTAAPHGTTQLCFEAFMEGVPVAFIPLNLVIGSQTADADLVTTTARPLSSAFASYASKDAPVVALLLSALKRWDPHAEVFMDCLDLTPNENWKHQLEQVIPSKDAFLLFWSTNASKSPWVAWELQHARSTKGLEWIRPMPIDDPETAPPPDFLQHLHFRDKYLIARQAFLRLEEQRTT